MLEANIRFFNLQEGTKGTGAGAVADLLRTARTSHSSTPPPLAHASSAGEQQSGQGEQPAEEGERAEGQESESATESEAAPAAEDDGDKDAKASEDKTEEADVDTDEDDDEIGVPLTRMKGTYEGGPSIE